MSDLPPHPISSGNRGSNRIGAGQENCSTSLHRRMFWTLAFHDLATENFWSGAFHARDVTWR